MSKKFLVVICGPTAVGKTSLAIELALKFNTEIISADSRQFFREMNIGTAKPTQEQLVQVKHHFINSLSVADEYNAGEYEKDALIILEKIFLKKNIAILAGGSGLYINALCSGFDSVPPSDKDVREKIIEQYKKEGIEYLRAALKKTDKEYYSKVDLSNPHRMIRAIEVFLITGKPFSQFRKGKKQKRNFSILKTGLNVEREELYKRINARVDQMMNRGLPEEVKSLAKQQHSNALNTVGYKELFEHLEGKISLQAAIEKIKQNTRHFAKRQLTWFKRDKEIKWFAPYEEARIIQHIHTAMSEK
ncbi:MAG: tRNA (adenosine(37)-N6)-dimethylallyltransferase MiaA [Bacteroidetes bacterium]|nr:tRNA (adenosine(37)-N6)-dimethylallyltransferase MiaA [Bacteroidota bacterium]